MRKFTRGMALLLALLLSLSLLPGCGSEPAAENPAPAAPPTEAPQESAAPEATALPEEKPQELTPAQRAEAKGLPAPPELDISSWEFKVANSYNNIMYYVPPYASLEGQGIDSRILDICCQLLEDARGEGIKIFLAATFRNYEFQFTYYHEKVRELGDAYEASKVFLGPGNNDHQVGLSFDITADPNMAIHYLPFDNAEVLDTEAYRWMLEHGTDYGFILRYPEGKEAYYGTKDNEGHFRYVGVEAARYITENDLCLEEFILLYDEDAIYVPGIH